MRQHHRTHTSAALLALTGLLLAGCGQNASPTTRAAPTSLSTQAVSTTAWQDADIGNTGAAGSFTQEGDTIRVTGAGDEIGGGYDQFHFTYQALEGDGVIVARVADIASANAGTKAAVVIRETLDGWPPARETIMGFSGANGAFFAARTEPQGFANVTANGAALPGWVKLERRGNVFTGFTSVDGQTWQQAGSATVGMGSKLYVGLAGGGETFGKLATSTFDHVSVATIDPPPVNVSVNWDQTLFRTSPLGYGLNGFKAFDPQNAASAKYNENLRYMNPGILRYHSMEMMGDSGTTPNGWIDTANRRWDAEKINTALKNLGADPVRLINIPTWPSWMDTDKDDLLDPGMEDAFANFCADLVRIVNVQGRNRVMYWEPTNERDDVYFVRPTNAGQPDRLNDLIDIYNRAARAMKAVDPHIQVGGPAFARADLYPQVRRFIAGTLNVDRERGRPVSTLDFLSIHGYASGDPTESDAAIYNRIYNPTDSTVNSLSKHVADIRAMLDEANGRRIPLWMDEYNISWAWWTGEERMHNNKGAVFDALAMVYLTGAGADSTMAWNEKDGAYGKTDENDALRPSAHLFHLMNRYMLGRRVAAQSADESAVAVAAVRGERGERAYLLINRSGARQGVVTTFQGWRPDGRRSTLDRYEISADGFTKGTMAWSDVAAGNLRLPPNSVTLIVEGK
ncbi:hypothetical protein DAETH_39080 (plasmid) [Deinococcus aetherius]|uniref:Glycosyl hydrolases family 39 N-terminal catalytic domain-containing protein n=1 Tax=Deinococcus aetherius TaxID=200252 RepID=A0ABM8AJD4_9DEIO|nr:hypothetical protein [Deinococcus aetherius]BDP43939.1 hypothetical protein DAETH_39080 [Deinococcus aetherius]